LSARTKARKRALDALYAADLTRTDALKNLQLTLEAVAGRQNQEEIFDYAETLVSGFVSNREAIDAQLTNLSDGWSLERMPVIDRNILRIGAWEILHNDQVPNEVAISEAVSLASEYSTEDSAKFVNGVLARLAKSSQAL
jgi:N utilization substance protein B